MTANKTVSKIWQCLFYYGNLMKTGPIPESKGMHTIFQKKAKRGQKRAKYLKIWAKIYKV